MELRSKLVSYYISIFVFIFGCYLTDAQWNGADMNINATLKLNESRNGSTETESSAVTTTPVAERQGNVTNIITKIKYVKSRELTQYKTATIVLAITCAVMFLALTLLTLRYITKSTSSMAKETPLEAKQPVESEYQSIRGLPRRETGNSYAYEYETVKPRLPPKRPPIACLLHSNDGEYENLKSRVRDSNPYVPMNEALVGSMLTESALRESALTGSAVILSGEDDDLYLTMKKLIRSPEDVTSIETYDCDI